MTLQVRDVTAGYGPQPVFTNVSLNVDAGELVLLVGPNGCGKTTLLRTIAGSLCLRQGSVHVDGEDVGAMSATRRARRIAIIAQSGELPERFTGAECVMMGRTPHVRFLSGESARDVAVVREAMRLTGCWEYRDRRSDELSGGERQRILIARALAQEPDLLLLDEPTSHLDLRHQVETFSLVVRLCREQGLAALGVVHDLTLAATFGDRIVLLADGAIVADGPPARVLQEDVLARVYGTRVRVLAHPLTGRPVVVPEISRLAGPDLDWLARVADPDIQGEARTRAAIGEAHP